MMKAAWLAKRNSKEILRDPLSLVLGVLLPVFLIVLFYIISKNAPIEVFNSVNIVPGVTVFGFTFTTMFIGLLIAKDKSSSFLTRLFISPLKSRDYIFGYFFPSLPVSFIIAVCCLLTGILVGIPLSWNLLFTFLSFLPFIIFSSFIGVFLGTLCNENQVVALGNIYIISSAMLGGAWMDLNVLGKNIKSVTDVLPFSHAIEASRIILSGRPDNIWAHLLIVTGYAILFFFLSIFFFNKKMNL